jgi:hypothetical protein
MKTSKVYMALAIVASLLISSKVAYCLDEIDKAVCDANESPDEKRICYEELEEDSKRFPSIRNGHSTKSNQVSVDTATTGVVCNEFDIIVEVVDRELTFLLSTDLPNDTTIMASVSRQYWQEGSDEAYSGGYFSRKTTVFDLKRPIKAMIDDTRWKNELEKTQKLFASIGEPFQVSKISDEVEIGLTVPINQKNPVFGKSNKYLEGPFVSTEGLRTIRIEKKFSVPFDREGAGDIVVKRQYSLDPYNLEINLHYRISKKTPISQEIKPKDPLKAIAEMKYLPPGSVIRIMKRQLSGSTPHYHVHAQVRGSASHTITGWINSIALMGQTLSVIE